MTTMPGNVFPFDDVFTTSSSLRSLISNVPSNGIKESRSDLEEARRIIQQQDEVLRNIQKEALILHTISKISKCKKFAYYEDGARSLRITAPEGLEVGHDVLLHPGTKQIVENLGASELQLSPFAPSKLPSVTWDDIGGLEDAKRDIQEAIELPFKEKKLFKFYKKRPIKGILLSGEPGNGKTMLGKAAANSLATIHKSASVKSGFLYVKGPEILNQYVGNTELTIRTLFNDAKKHLKEHGYPAIIFIDEADAILRQRGKGYGTLPTIVPAFLTEMDGLEESAAIVILATNRPDILDPAIIREGRIDRKIHVPRPNRTTAEQIIKSNLSKFPIGKDYSLDNLVMIMIKEIFEDGKKIDGKEFPEVINGAMLAACVDIAVGNAIYRDIGNEPTGLIPEDIIVAVNRIHSQNIGLTHEV